MPKSTFDQDPMRLVFIYGGAASGKLTVGRALAEMTGFKLFHNHLIVDAVGAVFPFGDSRFARLREKFWLDVFREAAEAGQSLIFTFAPEPTVAVDFPLRARAIVEADGGRCFFVRLTLSTDEQERRIANPSRAAFGKLRSLEVLRRHAAEFAACEAIMPSAAVTIDTMHVGPEEAARRIAAKLG